MRFQSGTRTVTSRVVRGGGLPNVIGLVESPRGFIEQLMQRGESFSFETVMSHPSKIEFFTRARAEGYKTYLYFVCTSSPELNVARVRTRVMTGGHAVPEDKIRERYGRSLDLARAALGSAYRAYFFDNSGREPVWLAEFDPQGHRHLKVEPDRVPRWFRDAIGNV